MALVILIIILALIEFTVFTMQVGWARGKYGVQAPATSGHEVFERYFRVQQNTLEQLVIFVPTILAFSWMAESIGWAGNTIAASLGVFWLIGRFLYAINYIKDPASRGLGFMMAFFPTAVMMIGTLVCVIISLL